MYRKIMWCYVFILTLLDISLNTKLTAQGKSHGVTVHDSLIEGITFQEWGKEAPEGGDGAGDGEGEGEAAGGAAAALRLCPAALRFGARALGAPHAATVTLTNTANTTLHLASVAGTTPDFHASFFEAKTLAPEGNTTFSVVYLGRREGAVSAHLYIHTSLGVRKYSVSAEGVASPWEVWPLVGVRVPDNATLEPLLSLRNPTPRPVQILEVYSSGAWLGLQLPDGGASARAASWTVPPHAARALVRLRVRVTPPHHAPRVAYVRIKTNASEAAGGGGGEGGGGGGALVVVVEARGAAAGEHARPLQLRLRARGAGDPPDTFEIELGNSLDAALPVQGSVWGAACAAAPPREPAPPPTTPPAPPAAAAHANGNGVSGHADGATETEGAQVSVVRAQLEPHQAPHLAARLTLDYGKLWAGYSGAGGAGEQAYCAGWVRLGRAALPYSVRLLRGTLLFEPQVLRFVSAAREEALREREVRAHNQFARPLQLLRLELEPHLQDYFIVEGFSPSVVAAGGRAPVAVVRARPEALAARPPLSLAGGLALHTDVSVYKLPLRLYTGLFDLEWEWPNSEDGTLRVGAVGTSQTRRVRARLRNPAPEPLCVSELRAALPGAQLALAACQAAHRAAPPAGHACRCVEAGGETALWLTLVAPAREGALAGSVRVGSAHGAVEHAVSLRAHAGRLHAHPLRLPDAAPYAWAETELVLESSMALRMRVLDVTQPAPRADPALTFLPAGGAGAEVEAGRRVVGRVRYAAERLCAPRCYHGLDLTSPEGAAWLERARAAGEPELRADAALVRERARLYSEMAGGERNVSLLVHTSHVVQLPAAGGVRLRWARLVRGGPAAGWAGLAGVRGGVTLRLPARNPSLSHALLLHAVLGPALPAAHALPDVATTECAACRAEDCVYSADAFRLSEWRATAGVVREWAGAEGAGADGGGGGGALPVLLLAPGAEVELRVTFAPPTPHALAAYLYLRNNLTVVESVQLAGRGAYPSFELAGRRPDGAQPLLFEVGECGAHEVRRTVVARNTGRVSVRLRDWRVAGAACGARGFRLQPCAPLALAPNESRALTLSFAADWTLARVTAPLELRTDLGAHAFPLRAAAPARLLPRCAARAPRPPFEPSLRAAGSLLTFALLALVLAAAALDAERLLRRARAARAPSAAPAPRAPLDLRALAADPAPAPAPPPRATPAPARRRRLRRTDPHAESRAFERWRDSLRRPDDDDDRSSEDPDADEPPPPPPRAPARAPPADEPPARDSPPPERPAPAAEPAHPPPADDDAASTGSDSWSPPDDADADDPAGSGDSADVHSQYPERDDAPAAPLTHTDSAPVTPEAPSRTTRARRDAGDTPRRSERRAADGEAPRRASGAKVHARKDKAAKRRERAPPTPPRVSPPTAGEARAPSAAAAAGAGGVRAGASWSSVVARSALAPIGSDVRRRAEPARAASQDHSLFYFNGEPSPSPVPAPCAAPTPRAEPDFSWRATPPPPPPPVERPAYSAPPLRDYLEERVAAAGGQFGSIGSVWGGGALAARAPGAAWPWGSFAPAPPPPGPVRPPPGFGATPGAPVGAAAAVVAAGGAGECAPRAVRAFDPFHSLASIWTRTALDWRRDVDSDADLDAPAPPDADR